MDRNVPGPAYDRNIQTSLSARRAWIEMGINPDQSGKTESLSARRAWIEIYGLTNFRVAKCVALRKESVDRNRQIMPLVDLQTRRSPQGERG